MCHCAESWICETHPISRGPHDDCADPGELCFLCNTSDQPRLPDVWFGLIAAAD